jgi:hypothetical protein
MRHVRLTSSHAANSKSQGASTSKTQGKTQEAGSGLSRRALCPLYVVHRLFVAPSYTRIRGRAGCSSYTLYVVRRRLTLQLCTLGPSLLP